MKNTFFALVIFCLGSYQITAQEVSFAGKFGFNISSIGGSQISGVDPIFGIHIGGLAEIPVQDKIYFQPEALISMQGADVGANDLRLTYLNFPLMGKYLITDKITAEAGPQFGVLIANNSDDFASVDTNSFDFGLSIGGGYRLNENFYFQVRHTFGVSKVIEGAKTRNGVFQISACYFF